MFFFSERQTDKEPIVSSVTVSTEDRPCEAGKECVPADSCEMFKAEREKLKSLSRGSDERKMLLEKLQSQVCNKEEKKICCYQGMDFTLL